MDPPNASWDIYYGIDLAAILDSSRKGGNFPSLLNNFNILTFIKLNIVHLQQFLCIQLHFTIVCE